MRGAPPGDRPGTPPADEHATAAATGVTRSQRNRRLRQHPTRAALRRGSRAVGALIALTLLIGSGLTFTFFNRLNSQAGTAASPKQVTGNVAAEGFDGEDMDILMIGTDTRTGTDIPAADGTGDDLRNTDTIMLIHVPADGSRASVVSFPRDTWVTLPTGEKGRINSAYAYGYASVTDPNATEQQRKNAAQAWLIQTVSALSGVQVDHFVEITLAGFRDLTRALGGIDVNLCQATQDLEYSGADFPAGPQHLDENQALAFVRQRHGLISDLDRIKRQQYFMGAMLRKVLDQDVGALLSPGKLTELIDAVAGTITFDEDLDALMLAEQMRNVATGNVAFYTLPIAGDATINGQQVLAPVSDEQMKMFFLTLSAPPPPEPVGTTAPDSAGQPGSEPSDASEQPPAGSPDSGPSSAYPGQVAPGVGATPTAPPNFTAANDGCIN